LVVWLYDRTFVSGGFAAAWRRHRWFHLGLAATWLLLGYLVITTGNRGETAGFGTEISWWAYALTQCRAIAHYLWLTVCPYPLVLDYGTETVGNVSEVLLPALVLGLLLTGVLIALRRRLVVGFLGVWFFAILAPSSSVVPVATQTMAEHRMYLPLAAVVVLVVLAIRFLAGRACLIVFLALAAGLGWLTERRNRDYHSELAIWSDTAAKQPANARAHCSLGTIFAHAGRLTDAASRFTEALRLDPQNAEAHSGLGAVFTQQGRLSEALVHYEAALRINPDDAVAHNDLGNALIGFSRFPEAITHCTEAIRLNPRDAKAHYNLGYALLKSGRLKEAIDHLEAAIRLKLDSADAHYNLGNALVQAGRTPEAVGQYEQAVRLAPTLVEAHGNLANALLQTDRIAEAVTQYKQALRLKPGDADVRFNLAVALRKLGRTAEAYRELLEVLRLKPDDAEAREELERLTSGM
jgi:protein O-mannosyl-transferase